MMDSGISYLSNEAGGVGQLDGRAPVLVAAASDAGRARGARAAEAAGFRVAPVALADAAERLTLQVASSALWIELEEDGGSLVDRLLERANGEAAAGRTPLIVAAPEALLDPVAARIDAASAQLLIDPNEAERAAALAIATGWRSAGATLHDVSNDPSSVRLRQLSDEVSRIAATLARLSSGASPTAAAPEVEIRSSERGAPAPDVTSEQIGDVIRARRLRARYFDPELFADPAWDMLLDLLAAEVAQHRVPVSSLCIAAAVPATTALRWIKTMSDSGLFVRRADPHDGRRVFVELAPQASSAMRRYFGEVGNVAAI